jgi:hypothetical protein
MPMKLNVGLCRKIGQPEYGSLGASCGVEVELSGSLLQDDLDAFQRQVRNAYVACAQAVNDELARHRQVNSSTKSSNESGAGHPRREVQADPSNGHNGNGGRLATEKQVTYIRQLAGQIKGLGVRRLESLSQRMFGKPVAGLTSLDASGLIDTCKAIKSGEINLDDALNGAAHEH